VAALVALRRRPLVVLVDVAVQGGHRVEIVRLEIRTLTKLFLPTLEATMDLHAVHELEGGGLVPVDLAFVGIAGTPPHPYLIIVVRIAEGSLEVVIGVRPALAVVQAGRQCAVDVDHLRVSGRYRTRRTYPPRLALAP